MADEFEIDLDEDKTESGASGASSEVDLNVLATFKQSLLAKPMDLLPVLLCALLWLVTAWIPFVNIGTTIALFTLPVWLADGRKISPVELFLCEHRAKLENFLLLSGLFAAAALAAWGLFSGMGLAPGCSMALCGGSLFWTQFRLLLAAVAALAPLAMVGTAWSLAFFLLLERGLEPFAAIRASAEATRGNRLRILAIIGIPELLGGMLCLAFSYVPYLRWILVPVTFLATKTIVIKLAGTVYGALRTRTGATA